jgi:hypothetical protein
MQDAGSAKKNWKVRSLTSDFCDSLPSAMRTTNDETRCDPLAGLRSAALIAIVFGAIAAVGLLRHAQQHPPPLLVFLFLIWVAAPFGLLGAANLFSKAWPIPVRKTLYVSTFVVVVVSLAIYVDDNFAHRAAHPAGVWVVVPPASVIVSGLTLAIAALRVRRRLEPNE